MRPLICHITIVLGIMVAMNAQPEGFVIVQELIPDVILEMRYAGHNNFLGRPVEGYKRPVLYITEQAARALAGVQQDLKAKGYGLKIFDAYRPQKAVDHFRRWVKDASDTLQKFAYYPQIDKAHLIELGYISARSGHTRGSTIDLTMVDLASNEEVDMGGPYDFFGPVSHHNWTSLTTTQKANRSLLKGIMEKHGFRAYSKEWWHYTLNREPFPDTYFNFDIR